MELSEKLRELRIKNHLTQRQLAELLGVHKSIISFYEVGDRLPSYAILIRYASIFHVSTDYLLGLDKSRTLDVSGLSEDDIIAVQGVIDALRRKDK